MNDITQILHILDPPVTDQFMQHISTIITLWTTPLPPLALDIICEIFLSSPFDDAISDHEKPVAFNGRRLKVPESFSDWH